MDLANAFVQESMGAGDTKPAKKADVETTLCSNEQRILSFLHWYIGDALVVSTKADSHQLIDHCGCFSNTVETAYKVTGYKVNPDLR